jgi:hypothetical protein
LKEQILDQFPSSVRVTYNVEKIQFILVGREIEPGVYASTVDWPDFDLNLWSNYYFDLDFSSDPNYETEYVDSNHVMKFDHWFYETNLKIRVVKQIRGTNGEYLGEIAVDFYKLRDYDKLFGDLE